jgi:Ca-activated chloride channel homolog
MYPKKIERKSFAPGLIITALVLFLFAAFFFGTSGSAQKLKQLPPPPPVPVYKPKPTPTPTPTPEPEYEVVKINSNLVIVPVSVMDQNGQPVLGLKQSDFRIEENGRQQQIAQIGDPEQVPLDIALLIDVSSSVISRFDFEQQAAASFLRQVLKSADRATIFAIDNSPRLIQELTGAQMAAQKIMTIRPSNSFTAFFDSVLAASDYLDKASGTGRRRIMVVISDGDDTARILNVAASDNRTELLRNGAEAQKQFLERSQLETQRGVQKAEVTFYSINPSGQTLHLNVRTARSEAGMERTAAATGGASFVPGTEADLPNIFQRIASEIRSQYLLQYYSDNKSGDRSFRRISVSTPTQQQLRVRTREGYYPKSK